MSLSSFGCAMGVDGLVFGRLVHWGAPCGCLDSSGTARLIGVRFGVVRFIQGHWGVQWGSSGYSGVNGFIGVLPGVIGFVQGRWVSWDASGVAEFIGVRT